MKDDLRKAVRVYKVENKKSYKEIAEELNINKNSFYNWLNGYYDLSEEKVLVLRTILNNREERK